MAVRRQPLAIIHDENAEINRGKPSVAKFGGLKAQPPYLLADRKTLSDISNKLKPLPNLGSATPIVPRKENHGHNNGKGGFSVMADPEFLGKSGIKGRGGIVLRTPLSNITNVESVQSSSKAQAAMKEKKAQRKNLRMGPSPRYEVTKEMKQKAEVWAREGVERANFTGKDMEALQMKMAEEEVDRHVAQALSYRTKIPCWLPRAFVKDPPEIKDHLEIDPVEDRCTKGGSFFHGKEQKVTHVDYDESYLECLEILENALQQQ